MIRERKEIWLKNFIHSLNSVYMYKKISIEIDFEFQEMKLGYFILKKIKNMGE